MRFGDIDTKNQYVSAKRMQEGIAVHGKLQKKRRKEAKNNGFIYKTELELEHVFSYKGLNYRLSGRADGIKVMDASVEIEEFKSTYKKLDEFDRLSVINSAHMAQAKCYALMYMLGGLDKHEADEISVSVTYVHCETLEEASFSQIFTTSELQAFLNGLLDGYHEFAKFTFESSALSRETASELKFPYGKFRPNQREFSAWVYKCIKEKNSLFCQAPTGTGKTMSTLFPSVKAIGSGICDKVFYLTAKTTTRTVAEDAVSAMESAGLRMMSVTLTGKEKVCPNTEFICSPSSCPWAKGHYDRINNALLDILRNNFQITAEGILLYAIKHMVCPGEFQLDVCDFAHLIVCDYNYVYDPKVQLKRFFAEGRKQNFVLLTDEAHNLIDRARDMYSAALTKQAFLTARKIVGAYGRKTPMYKALSGINSCLLSISKTLEDAPHIITDTIPEELLPLLSNFLSVSDSWLTNYQGVEGFTDVLDVYFAVWDFIRTAEFYDERYKVFIERRDGLTVSLLNLDPSYRLSSILEMVRAGIFFSATLTPAEYFKTTLGGGESDKCIYAPSPYSPQNLCVMIDSSVSVKYRDRPYCYKSISEDIHAFVSARTGNYFVFFSSYDFLTGVAEIFMESNPDVEVIVQNRNMNEDERAEFLNGFSDCNSKTLVGFLVLGGIFSEGIDLKGERLVGAVIVGVGLPMITARRNVISEYFSKTLSKGFEYAYMYPGMNKVLQAAGRVIRTESDKGAVLFIDSRFSRYEYYSLLPEHYQHYVSVRGSAEIHTQLNKFWNKV